METNVIKWIGNLICIVMFFGACAGMIAAFVNMSAMQFLVFFAAALLAWGMWTEEDD